MLPLPFRPSVVLLGAICLAGCVASIETAPEQPAGAATPGATPAGRDPIGPAAPVAPPATPPTTPTPPTMPPPPAAASQTGRLQRLSGSWLRESFRPAGYDVNGVPSGDSPAYLHAADANFRLDEIEALDRLVSGQLPSSFDARYGKKLTDCEAMADAAPCLARVWSGIAFDLWGIGPADAGAAWGAAHVELRRTLDVAAARQYVLRVLATDPEFLFVQRPPLLSDARSLALFKRWASYTLTGSPAAVIADARAATRATAPDFVAALLAKPEFATVAARFYRHLLHVDGPVGLLKDSKLFPFYTIQFANSVSAEFDRHVAAVVKTPGASLTSVLFTPVVLPANLATVFAPVEAASAYGDHATERIGIFSHPAVLGSFSVSNDTAPLHNGLAFLDDVLCQVPPPPPLNPDDLPAPEDDPKRSRRANFDALTAAPACRGCHDSINPVSFAFELYDAAGRLRPGTDAARYDARGELRLTSGRTIRFANAMHLAKQLDGEPQVMECQARRWVEHLLGGSDGADAAEALDRALKAARAGGDLRAVVAAAVLPATTGKDAP